MKKIAIQGGYGAFHEIAAHHYFKNDEIEILPRNTFRDMVTTLKDRQCDFGIMAIENSLAGSIIPNYNLIINSSMHITGEIYLRIKQNLVAMPGVKLSELQEVYSHPMAILQCQSFFDKNSHIRLIESMDTALSAQEVAEKGARDLGAISSRLAAEKYGLEIIAESIETNKKNYTRFLILSENGIATPPEKVNKASIFFTVAHKFGSLTTKSTWPKFSLCQSLERIGNTCSLWMWKSMIIVCISDRLRPSDHLPRPLVSWASIEKEKQ